MTEAAYSHFDLTLLRWGQGVSGTCGVISKQARETYLLSFKEQHVGTSTAQV